MEEQPDPTPNKEEPIWEKVIRDMRERDNVGRQRYGTPLQAFNGRDALLDAYAEVLDLCVYLRQEIEERKARIQWEEDHIMPCVAEEVRVSELLSKESIYPSASAIQLSFPAIVEPKKDKPWRPGGPC